jgi:hypothetical protein
MSIFAEATAICPTCRTEASLTWPASINADRRPDLRAAILDGTLYTLPCRTCGETLTFEPHISYLDVGRRQWILAESVDEAARWREHETNAGRVFDLAFGAASSPAARAIGERLATRIVFGWPAMAEKLRCADLGIDDAVLEVLKLAIVGQGPSRPLNPDLDLRLLGQEGTDLALAWVDRETGEATEQLTVPEAAWLAIKAEPEPWRDAMAAVTGPLFVDMSRLLRDAEAETLAET